MSDGSSLKNQDCTASHPWAVQHHVAVFLGGERFDLYCEAPAKQDIVVKGSPWQVFCEHRADSADRGLHAFEKALAAKWCGGWLVQACTSLPRCGVVQSVSSIAHHKVLTIWADAKVVLTPRHATLGHSKLGQLCTCASVLHVCSRPICDCLVCVWLPCCCTVSDIALPKRFVSGSKLDC